MLKISHKIFLVLATQLAIFFAMLVASSVLILQLDRHAQEATTTNLKHEAYIRDLDEAFNLYFITVESSLAVLDLKQLAKNKETLSILTQHIRTISSGQNSQYFKIIGEGKETLENNLTSLHDVSEDVFSKLQNFAQMQAYDLYAQQAAPIRADITQSINKQKRMIAEALQERRVVMRSVLRKANNVVFMSMILLLFVSLGLGLFLWRSTITPIETLKEFVSNKFKDVKSNDIPFVDRHDEIGDFAKSFKSLFQQKEAYEMEVQAQSIDLVQAKEEAEKSNHAKSDFLANMSHELRTPLNSITGMLQLCSKEDMSDETWEMIEVVRKSSNSLISTVNDILDLSKIEAGEVQLEYIAFDLNETVQDLIQSMLPMASKKNLSLNYSAPPEPIYTLGDPVRFLRIITNLVGNAINYTEKGEINVRVSYELIFDDQIMLHCEVEDTGIGIPKDRIAQIFDKFTQADTSTTRKFGGTGLGLTITKELVELMDGVVGVDSKVGKGSVFWFQVPFEVVNELPDDFDGDITFDDGDNLPALPPMAMNILLAEDNEMNQVFMKRLFKRLGFSQYKIADNGKAAFDEIQNNFYDLVLMDCHMPEMSGYEVTEAVRALDDNRNSIPIIAMTANAMPKDKEKCLDIGMDAYISKPVDIKTFKSVLSHWVDFNTVNIDEFDVTISPDISTKAPQKNDAAKVDEQDSSVDLTNLIENSMGDADFVKEIVGMFIGETEKHLQQLSSLEKEPENLKDWVEVSHALKGAAGGVGAEEMRGLCEISQKMERNDPDARAEMAQKISKAYEQVKADLIKGGYYTA